jgi:hypothetical protein
VIEGFFKADEKVYKGADGVVAGNVIADSKINKRYWGR